MQAWLGGLGRWHRLGIAILAGASMTLGHAPVDFPWILFLALPVSIWLIDAAATWRQAASAGWGIGFGYFVTGLHWIGHAFLVDAEKFAWLMPFAVTLLPAFLAVFWAGAFVLAHRLWRPGLLRVAVFAAALTSVELLRGHVLTGFPWALPGYIWAETPVLQAASWAGPYGLTLLTLLLGAAPLVAVIERRWLGAVLPLAALAGLWAWGAQRMPQEVETAPDAPVLRVVQPNAPQDQKWHPEHAPRFYRRLLRHSAEPSGTTPDLIIWPETAVPFIPQDHPAAMAEIAGAAQGAPVILGSLRRDPIDGTWRNAMVTVLPDGQIGPVYDKHHLVPFGEYNPLGSVFSLLGMTQLAEHGGLSPGQGPQTLSIEGVPPFTVAICYEMIFPHEIVGPGARPDWILTITNDAWFGGFAGPQQHLAQARFRAVEQGLPVARSANTGISTIIDSYGRITQKLRMHNDGFLDQALPIALPPTIYSTAGNLPAILACLLVLMIVVLKNYYRIKIDK